MDISGEYWYEIRRSAERRNIDFNLSVDEIWELFQKQRGLCALTGIPLSINYRNKNEGPRHNASLDRIDSSRGYTIDNVHWVLADINNMKGSFSQEYFVKLCELVSSYYRIQQIRKDLNE